MLSSILLAPRRRSSIGGQLVDCLDVLVRWGRFHCCEAPKVLRVNSKTHCDSVRSVSDWLDKSVIEGTDEPSRIFVLTHLLPDRDADVTHAPSNEEVCTVDASLAQFARAVHTWKSGHDFFDHFVCDFQHGLSSAHQERKNDLS